jgi:hypothetical protein
MTTAVKLVLAAVLTASLLLAWLGPPPPWRVTLGLRGLLLACGLLGFGIAALALALDAIVVGALTLVVSTEVVCAAGWLGRGELPPEDDDGDGGGGGGGGRKPPPTDWDAFERAFARYARDRDRQPA